MTLGAYQFMSIKYAVTPEIVFLYQQCLSHLFSCKCLFVIKHLLRTCSFAGNLILRIDYLIVSVDRDTNRKADAKSR